MSQKKQRKISKCIQAWLEQVYVSEPVVISIGAGVVGLLSGVIVWLFKLLITECHTFMFDIVGKYFEQAGHWTVIAVPVLGGLVVGLLVFYFIGRERYHGISGVIESCALAGGKLPYSKLPVKVIASAISIGSGASVGPEDPSVQIGTNIGSMLGQLLRLTEDRTRALVAGGAAAGIAAAFNAPIAGVFFALEVVLGELSSTSFAFAAISAVISSVFTQAVTGTQPAFIVPQYSFNSAWELPLYLVLGLLAGPLSAAYIYLIVWFGKLFHGLTIPEWSKPAVAGLGVGLVGVFYPQLFGVGYDTIGSVLTSSATPALFLLFLLVAKLILTPLSIGAGFVGGVFAPSLFLGAMLGGAFGVVSSQIFPSLGISAPAFAMVGMAAVLAGTVHAPLTAILLLFEMTHDYRIILPLMFSVAVSLAISRKLQKDSIYRLPLAKNGIRIEGGKDVEVLEGITVQEVMSKDLTHLNEGDSLASAVEFMSESGRHGLPVLNASGDLAGLLTLADIRNADAEDQDHSVTTIGEICSHHLVTTYPDDTIGAALKRMSVRNIGRLPVVERDNPLHLLGLLRRRDIIRAYDAALAKRVSSRHRIQQVRLGILSGAEVHELIVRTGSLCANKHIADLTWPRHCVISSIRRGRIVLLPHGDTVINPGDVLVVVTEADGFEKARQLCEAARAE